MANIFSKFFGDPTKRLFLRYQDVVEAIRSKGVALRNLSDDELRGMRNRWREARKQGRTVDELLPEVFAGVREASRRTANLQLDHPVGTLGMEHFDVQLIAGLVLHEGRIAEMKTGEGKTLVATLPLVLNAIEGEGAHLVTVNDYLARRDTLWMGWIYHALGFSVGCIQHDRSFLFNPAATGEEATVAYLQPVSRREAYAADLTYGTNNEFGFDYLRDNMVQHSGQRVQRGLQYAIVDEVDSILIDESRTPLIISGPAEEATGQYAQFSHIVSGLIENEDYNVDEKMRAATLTEAGIHKVEKILGLENLYTEGGVRLVHHLEAALKARALFKLDRDYVIKDGQIIIVDQFTGRLMPGRRFSEGLHQAIEAKEHVEVKQESLTFATITFQNYFRMYKKLSGMTGTAATEAEEFHKIYHLDVVEVPTHRPMIRGDRSDRVYKTEKAKFTALTQEIRRRHEQHQPVLVGTVSIEKNELLHELLERDGIVHEVLNAKNHEREAEIIKQAGRPGAVTVATNMAGRGTDIVLGGNPAVEEERRAVLAAGGLCVLGTERHESRRIDNQLRGRSGRQGDPGESIFFVSMEDDLMRIFGSDRMKSVMDTLRVPDDLPIENKLISKSIEQAQKKIEGFHFDTRKHLVEYDDVMNRHREVIYRKRNEVLASADQPEGYRSEMLAMIEQEIEHVVSFHTSLEQEHGWNLKEIVEVMRTIFPLTEEDVQGLEAIQGHGGGKVQDMKLRTAIIEHFGAIAEREYQSLESRVGNLEMMRQLERTLVLPTIDLLWVDHLEQMGHLREGIGLQGYGQRDPLVEYKKEGYRLFTQLIDAIQKEVVYSIYKIGVPSPMVPKDTPSVKLQMTGPAKTMQEKETQSRQQQDQRASSKIHNDQGKKVGRNDPCLCGSGKKYKKCHGK
ncbi:MAG: preprotein translocase subunit SecA [Patescibacteria group bacterium]